MRLKTRRNTPVWFIAVLPILSILVAFILGAFFIIWAGESPITAYIALINGALGSSFAITESLTRAIPLIFTGLAAAVAFRAKFWNIGAEGQLYCGAMAATLVGTGMIDLPSIIMIPVLFIAGALAGCLILLLPVFLKNVLVGGLGWDTALAAHLEFVIVGILIIVFLIAEPHGLAQLWRVAKEKLRLWPFPH